VPARDIFHDAVRHALEKEEWTITHDPLHIRTGGVAYHIDLGAEKLLAAEKNGEKIAVEIKSFVGVSTASEFHTALGQYIEYRLALKEKEPGRILYLAVPVDMHDTFFMLPFIQNVVKECQLKLLVYHPKDEVILAWKK
jgi:hypothetical protein